MSDRADPVERALELLVLAPLGALLYLREMGPGVVRMLAARGRAEIDRQHERVQTHVTTVRSTGEVAIAFGVPMLRDRLRRRAETPREPAPASHPEPDAAAPEPAGTANGAVAPAPIAWAPLPARPTVDAPSRDELPIPGYDALSASQVVERLVGLAPGELDAVHAYEVAHRQRRTILGKIEQLAG